MKKSDQLATELKGWTRLSPAELFEVAEQAAEQITPSSNASHSVVLQDTGLQDGQVSTQQYAIRRGRWTTTTLEVWVELTAGNKLPTGSGRILFHADWSDEVVERMAGGSNVGSSLVRLASLYLFGMKGYDTYRRYLDALAQAVHNADPKANVEITVGD